MHTFQQVDVFCSSPYSGNPVAVVFEADCLSVEAMQSVARWTNLSETTFVQSATESSADYQVRIFTPRAELPFAGHPSIGTGHAVIESGFVDAHKTKLVQQCGAGLIELKVDGTGEERQIFVAGPKPAIDTLPDKEQDALSSALDLLSTECEESFIIDVGPRWLTLELASEESVRGCTPNFRVITEISTRNNLTGLTIFSLADKKERYQVCVRSFAPAAGIDEDPVCGSGNICVGTHLHHTGRLPLVGQRYVASQGREMGRDGYATVLVEQSGEKISVGGKARTCLAGSIDI